MAGRILDRLQVRLNLTPDQIARIRPIIARSAVELRLVRADTALRINKVFDDSYAQVSALLTADQRTKLDEMQRKRRENMQLHLGGRWRPGAGLGGPLRRGPGDDDGQSPAPATP
jgi:Spy/CpxP family protein refolding chaperone